MGVSLFHIKTNSQRFNQRNINEQNIYSLKKHFISSLQGKQLCLAFGFSHLIYLPSTHKYTRANRLARPHLSRHSLTCTSFNDHAELLQRLYPLSILFYFVFFFGLCRFSFSMKIVYYWAWNDYVILFWAKT